MEQFVYKKVAGITALSASMSDFEYKKHGHQEYAIGVTLKGKQYYCLDGRAQLSHPEGVMLFNPEAVHDGMAYGKEQLDYVMLYVAPELLMSVTQQAEPVRFTMPITYHDGLKQHVLRLSQAILTDQDDALCRELLVDLADVLVSHNDHVPMKKDSVLVAKAKDMIRAGTDQVLIIEDICQALDINVFQFIRLFKKQTGITPYQYVLNCKVEQAKAIIEKTGDVYMAVSACGFFDLTHLNKQFKRIYGVTAFEYFRVMVMGKPGRQR